MCGVRIAAAALEVRARTERWSSAQRFCEEREREGGDATGNLREWFMGHEEALREREGRGRDK